MDDERLTDLLTSLPKVELHVHLEGATDAETAWCLAQRNGVHLPAESLADWKEHYVFRNFPHFIEVYGHPRNSHREGHLLRGTRWNIARRHTSPRRRRSAGANALALATRRTDAVLTVAARGVSSPDWAGFILAPPSDVLTAAVTAYATLQTRNGGDVNVGSKLSTLLTFAGFLNCQMTAQYEVYPSLPLIGEYLAIQLERAGDSASTATFRKWSQHSGGMFAQCWVSCLAQKPSSMVGGEGIDRNG